MIVNALGRVPIYTETVRECRKEDQARIQALESRVQELEKGQTPPVQGKGNWAQVAGNRQPQGGQVLYIATARRGPAPVQVKKLDNTKIRRTVVKIRDDAE